MFYTKKLFLSAALLCSVVSASASVSMDLAVGVLLDKSGNPIPENSLVQLLYLTSGELQTTPLSVGSFLHENEVLIHSYALDSTSAGEMGLLMNAWYGNLTAGLQLFMRWWPTLTVGSSVPSAGVEYGQTNPLYMADWTVPADGTSAHQLNYLYIDWGGNVPEADRKATYQVIPEPSTYAALGGLALLGVALIRRRKQ